MNDRGEIWPPNLPEFLGFCREQLGPPSRAALREALSVASRRAWDTHYWTHAAIYRAASELGAYQLQHGSEREIKQAWRSAYAGALDDVARGQLPDASLAAPNAR